jgi:dihydrodipicolinate synthase/N-acetylneuraminate lyase
MEGYSHKLDAVRVAATISDEAVPIFNQLLTCGDPRVVEAALLAMGSDLAKEFRAELLDLSEQEDHPPPIRQLAAILLTDGDAEV